MPHFLTAEQTPAPLQYSICCIITSLEEYGEMKKSFELCGFHDSCEYLVADNTSQNNFDAYTAINRFLRESNGEYIIIVHQDVRCVDSRTGLRQILSDLNQKDPRWAVCGNAGAMGYHQDVCYIENNGKVITYTNLPAKVYSLDENFLIVRQSASIAVSSDLNGFHFYAADLCLIADCLGYSCYVIPFMVNHLSLGDLKAMEENKEMFLDKYGQKLRSRFIQTPSTKFILTRSSFKNRLYNGPLFFLVKWMEGIRFLFKRSAHKRVFKKNIR